MHEVEARDENLSSYLIPYVDPRKIEGHIDPVLEEFTYGDGKTRGEILRKKVNKGDFLFFHTNRKGNHVITAYYFVERAVPTEDAKKDKLILLKYKNPHLFHEVLANDTIVFGNPIYSKILRHPLIVNEAIQKKLSRKPKKIDRPWIRLEKEDVKFLLNEIDNYEKKSFLKDTFLSSDEVEQLLEGDIERFIESNPKMLDKNLSGYKRQYVLKSGDRLDLLFRDKEGLVVVEIKKGAIGREALKQIKRYLKEVKSEFKCKVSGVIICSDILPAFEEFFIKEAEKENIAIYLYSWKFNLRTIQS